MNEDFVTYNQAEKLADLGFDYKCTACYNEEEFEMTSEYSNYNLNQYRYNIISAPTLSHAQKWLREVKRISVEPISCGYADNVSDKMVWSSFICNDKLRFDQTADFNSYEQALSKGLDIAIEILEQQSNEN